MQAGVQGELAITGEANFQRELRPVLPVCFFCPPSKSALTGNYGFRFAGQVPGAGGGPIVASGVFTADGQGNITDGSITFLLAGNSCTASIVKGNQFLGSRYTIDADGEASLQLAFNDCPVDQFVFSAALDALDVIGVAHHVELAGMQVTGNFPSGNPVALVVTGEANFQRGLRPVLPMCVFCRPPTGM
jgi:hypothetical protein